MATRGAEVAVKRTDPARGRVSDVRGAHGWSRQTVTSPSHPPLTGRVGRRRKEEVDGKGNWKDGGLLGEGEEGGTRAWRASSTGTRRIQNLHTHTRTTHDKHSNLQTHTRTTHETPSIACALFYVLPIYIHSKSSYSHQDHTRETSRTFTEGTHRASLTPRGKTTVQYSNAAAPCGRRATVRFFRATT